jgi:flagellar hook-basal body complex protein FliE
MAEFRIPPIVAPALPATSSIVPAGRGGEGFTETLKNAVAAVNDLQLDARDAAVAVASGTAVDSAQAIVAIEKANVSFQFALQIRNKLLEAYQEIMRMSV